SVDDRATYLLMVRFAQEWFPKLDNEAPSAALARAQSWLRTVTNRELLAWHASTVPVVTEEERRGAGAEISMSYNEQEMLGRSRLVAVRGRGNRYTTGEAEGEVHLKVKQEVDLDARPYVNPIYWAAFQVTGW
ncbi:MAG: CHAT domain-containing protein, partial [Ktedonobacteraceae bacterium]